MDLKLKLKLFAIFLLSFGLDQVTKSLAVESWPSLGPIFFQVHTNSGFILQSLTNVSSLARVVFISSLYGFLFFGFFLLQSFLSEKLISLRVGLTLFFSAVTGNGFDRAFHGAVTDFICFNFGSNIIYFNVADIIMWVGLALIVVSAYRDQDQIWHPRTKRKQYLIDQSLQYKRAFQTSLIAFSSSLILILFSYSFALNTSSFAAQDSNKTIYLFSAALLGILFSAITFYSGVFFSHRSAGPLYAFERYVEALLNGENQTFELRKTDDHQHLMIIAEKLKNNLKQTKE